MWHSFLRTAFSIVFAMSSTIVSIPESDGLVLNWQHETGDEIRLRFEIPSLTRLKDGASYSFSASNYSSTISLPDLTKPEKEYLDLDYSPDSADISALDFSGFAENEQTITIRNLSWNA